MIIPRYKSFRAYYGSVYRELVGYTFLYQTAILTGGIVGYRLVWYTHHVQAFDERQFWDHRYVCLWENCFRSSYVDFYSALECTSWSDSDLSGHSNDFILPGKFIAG